MDPIIIGDTLSLEYTLPDYSSDTYDIWIALRGVNATIDLKDGESGVTITKANGDFTIAVTAAATAGWAAGLYNYAIYAGKTSWSEKYQVYTGQVELKADISAQSSGYDGRSHSKKVLDAIEAVIENRASQDQQSYTIAGRSITKLSVDELLKFREYYKSLYNQELKKEKAANSDGTGQMVKARF